MCSGANELDHIFLNHPASSSGTVWSHRHPSVLLSSAAIFRMRGSHIILPQFSATVSEVVSRAAED